MTLLLMGLVSLSGCGAISGASGASSKVAHATPKPLVTAPIPTPAIPAATSLAWSAGQLPQASVTSLGVAQSDGVSAYVCAPTTDNALTVAVATWVTHDRGVSWQRMADFTLDATKVRVDGVAVNSPITVTGCQILVDPAHVNTAIAQPLFSPVGGCMPGIQCRGYAQYATTNGGVQWSFLQSPLFVPASRNQDPLNHLLRFGSWQGVTYALFETTPQMYSFSVGSRAVVLTSHDGLRTWTLLPSISGVDLWVNPRNGTLLLETADGAFTTSTDGGANWSEGGQSPFQFSTIAVQQPFTDQPWRICGGNPSATLGWGQPNSNIDNLACSSDGGLHWTTHHLQVPNDLGGEAHYSLVGIADDGAALLTTPRGLERLVDGVDGIEPLGPVPTSGVFLYAAGGGAGTLWAVAQRNSPSSPLDGPIFTARYV